MTFQKRMANRWSMNASYAYNDAIDVWDSAAAYEDPTCDRRHAVPRRARSTRRKSAGSGIGNVFQNAKWLVKLNGRVQLPLGINLAANYLRARASRSRSRS